MGKRKEFLPILGFGRKAETSK